MLLHARMTIPIAVGVIAAFVTIAGIGTDMSAVGQSPPGASDSLLGGPDLLDVPEKADRDVPEKADRDDGRGERRGDADKDPHRGLGFENCYPSAEACRKCHPNHYDQWRTSGHAYSAVSPMFHTFDAAMQHYTRGTVGSFCVRCHVPVGTQLGMPSHANILDAPPVVREGVTCIACHRIREHYYRSNGDRRIEPGDIHADVGRAGSGRGLAAALASAQKYKLKLAPEPIHNPSSRLPDANPRRTNDPDRSEQTSKPGQAIHAGSYFFEPLKTGEVCVSCHQVAVHPGIWLEVVHAQYRSGPAHARGVTCNACHMGEVPGKDCGYALGHAAELNGKPYGDPRPVSNHSFWGPGYSIAHPGVFPHNPDASDYSPREWMSFNYRDGWGTEEFERDAPPDATFPPPWDNADERRDGRKVIDANLELVQRKRRAATLTMGSAVRIEGPIMSTTHRVGMPMTVRYRVHNISDGHNLPTGSLGAQPQLWLNAVLIDPLGRRVWESGYLDSNADLADLHSTDVATGRIRRDANLFNLQTKFLINNVRGTDRQAALPLNFSLDQLVFLRPGAVPTTVLNHPPLIRMEAHSIPPLDHKTARYAIPAEAFSVPGAYRLSVRMRSRTEPMYFMRQIGATPEMIRRMNENMIDVHPQSHTFRVH